MRQITRLKPSGMEKKARPRIDKNGKKKKRGRGKKNDRLTINETKILQPDNIPEGSVFKGYEDYIVQDLIIMPWTVRYRRGRWITPDGKTIVADLPEGICGIPEIPEDPENAGVKPLSFQRCSYVSNQNVHSHRL